MSSLYRSRFASRWRAVCSACGAAVVLVGCADREPAGPDAGARLAVAAEAGVAVTVPVRSGQCSTEGTTVTAWKVGPAGDSQEGKTYYAKVENSMATFSDAVAGSEPLTPGQYLVVWKPVLYANLLQQRQSHQGQVFAPFGPARGGALGSASNCTAVLYDPSQGNNNLAYTTDNVERALGSTLVRVESTALRLNPITVGSRAGAELTVTFLDSNGQPAMPGNNAYRLQAVGPRAAAVACYDPAREGRFGGVALPDYCMLARAFLDGEAQPDGGAVVLASTNPGLWFIEARGEGRRSYLASAMVVGEGAVAREAMAQGQLAFTYYLTGGRALGTTPRVPIATAGWLLDAAGTTSSSYQVALNGLGEGEYTVEILPQPEKKGAKPQRFTAACTGGRCVQTSKGKVQLSGIWSTHGTPAQRDGTLVVTLPLNNVTTACAKVSTATDTAPAAADAADAACGAFGGRYTEKRRSGGHSFSVAN